MKVEPDMTLLEELSDLLEQEHGALIAGDLDRVARLAEQKETLIGQIGDLNDLEPAEIVPLRGKIQRNHSLLEGALGGLRDVIDRMAALKSVRLGLHTYDRSGKRTIATVSAQPSVEKRA